MTPTAKIDIAGRRAEALSALGACLEAAGYEVHRHRELDDLFAGMLERVPEVVCLSSEYAALPLLIGRTIERHPELTVLVIREGLSSVQAEELLLEAGAYAVIAPPFERAATLVTLRNAVERSRLRRRIDALEGRSHAAPRRTQADAPAAGERPAPGTSLQEIERDAIEAALERTGGNVSEVVRQLGIGRTTIYRKLKKYGLR